LPIHYLVQLLIRISIGFTLGLMNLKRGVVIFSASSLFMVIKLIVNFHEIHPFYFYLFFSGGIQLLLTLEYRSYYSYYPGNYSNPSKRLSFFFFWKTVEKTRVEIWNKSFFFLLLNRMAADEWEGELLRFECLWQFLIY
jgi:hypothetical protein